MVEIDWGIPLPESAQELTYAERMIVHALRMWAHDRRRWIDVILEFNRVCGPQPASRICQSLDGAFHELGTRARRRIRLHLPMCCHVSPDELCVLNLVAAIQHGEPLHAQAVARWLLPAGTAPGVTAHLAIAAEGLFACGYELPLRRPAPAREAEDAPRPVRVVH